MAQHKPDIVIFGGGIAGLWALNYFQNLGYDTLLLESRAIGCGQTIASQGIIHSGLKYAFVGKINALAQSISAMPDLWRAALRGEGPVNLSTAHMSAQTQLLLIPTGFMGGLVKLATQQLLGESVVELKKADWPDGIINAGFNGHVIAMNEPVLNIPSVLNALTSSCKSAIKWMSWPDDPLGFLEHHNITAKNIIFTAADANAQIAKTYAHDQGLSTQKRPLLMGMIKNAPFELYAHLVGASEKPVATITTHKNRNGEIIWYIGGAVAERPKESDPAHVLVAMREAFEKYFPKLHWQNIEWSTLAIDRAEGKSSKEGWMPDTPTIHQHDTFFYCWPTKLTFAPLLANTLAQKIQIKPSHTSTAWTFLEDVPFANTPWDDAKWKKEN